MSNKYKTTQYIDGLTTAERSIANTKRLDTINEIVDQIGDVIQPSNNLFGDGSTVSTQETRAEDIISVEDIRLQGEIDGKVDATIYTTEQSAQDVLIQANTDAINSNDVDIAALDGRISANEGDITTINNELTAQAALDAALIAENVIQDNRLDAVEAKDLQQDGRLDILEGEIGTVGIVSSVYEDSVTGFNSTAPVAVTPNITTDFTNIDIAENNFVDQAPLSVIVKQDSTVRFDFNYTAANATTNTPKITVELYNVTKSLLIDKNELTLDFTGSTSIQSGNQFNIGEVSAGDEVTVFVYIDAGIIDFTTAKGLMTVTTSGTTTGDTIYDYNITSTSTVGGTTTLEDINYLNANKLGLTEVNTLLEDKLDKVVIDEISGNQIIFGKQSEDIYKIVAVDSTNTGVEIGFDIGNQVIVLQNLTNGEFSPYTPKFVNSAVNKKYVDDNYAPLTYHYVGGTGTGKVATLIAETGLSFDAKSNTAEARSYMSLFDDTSETSFGRLYFQNINGIQTQYAILSDIDDAINPLQEENKSLKSELEFLKDEIIYLKQKIGEDK